MVEILVRYKIMPKKTKVTFKAVDNPFRDDKPDLQKRDPMKDKKKQAKKTAKKKGPKVPEKVIQAQVESYLAQLGITPIRLPDSLFTAIFAPKIKTKTGWKTQSVPLHVKSLIST